MQVNYKKTKLKFLAQLLFCTLLLLCVPFIIKAYEADVTTTNITFKAVDQDGNAVTGLDAYASVNYVTTYSELSKTVDVSLDFSGDGKDTKSIAYGQFAIIVNELPSVCQDPGLSTSPAISVGASGLSFANSTTDWVSISGSTVTMTFQCEANTDATNVTFKNVDQDGNSLGETTISLNDVKGNYTEKIFTFTSSGTKTVSLEDGTWMVDVESESTSCSPDDTSFSIVVKNNKVYKENGTTIYSNNVVKINNTCEEQSTTSVTFKNVDENGKSLKGTKLILADTTDVEKEVTVNFTSDSSQTISLVDATWLVSVESNAIGCTADFDEFIITVKDGKVYKGQSTSNAYSNNTITFANTCNISSVNKPTLTVKAFGSDSKALSGIEFSLLLEDKISIMSDIQIGPDSTGTATLDLGKTYYITQLENSNGTNVLEGYEIFDEYIKLNVSSTGEITCSNCTSLDGVTFSNNILTITIPTTTTTDITKVVFRLLDGNGKRLSGAKFKLYEKGFSTALFSWTSSDLDTTQNLSSGTTYILKQTGVPTNYSGIDDFEIRISDNGKVDITPILLEGSSKYAIACEEKNCDNGVIIIVNQAKVPVPDTAVSRSTLLIILGILLSIGGAGTGIYAIYHNKKQTNGGV